MSATITKPQHHTTIRVFRVAEIRPNPFRDIERYPLEEKKIEALCESIRTTGFWDNLVARIGEDGKPEIAYGHHRLEAVHRVLGDGAKVGLIIRELDDEKMLQIMVEENMQEWRTSATVEQESLRAVIRAYAAEKIELALPGPKVAHAKLRFAPSFLQGGDDPNVHLDHKRRRYTSATLAKFTGWREEKVRIVLQALELIELDVLEPSMFAGLGPTKARALVEGVRKVAQESVSDVPESWKVDNNSGAPQMDRLFLRNHMERKVAAWRVQEGSTQGFDPLRRLFGKVGPISPIRVRLKGCPKKAEASKDEDSKSLLDYVLTPTEQYPGAVWRFIKATEALQEQSASKTKNPTVQERREMHQLLVGVRRAVDKLDVALGEVGKGGEKKQKQSRSHRGKAKAGRGVKWRQRP